MWDYERKHEMKELVEWELRFLKEKPKVVWVTVLESK